MWKQVYWAWATAPSYTGLVLPSGVVTSTCYGSTGKPLPPQNIYSGSIMIYDAKELAAKQSLNIPPLVVVVAGSKGKRTAYDRREGSPEGNRCSRKQLTPDEIMAAQSH